MKLTRPLTCLIAVAFLVLLPGCSFIARPTSTNTSNTPPTNTSNGANTPTTSLGISNEDRIAGIAGAQNEVQTTSQVVYSLSIKLVNGSLPNWFIQDLQIASEASFPIAASGYGLNLDEPSYEQPPRAVTAGYRLGVMGPIWVGGGGLGVYNESSFMTFAGPIDMKSLYKRAKRNPQDFALSWIYTLKNRNGTGIFEAAVLWFANNGRFVAFAPDQVIIGEDHAGRDGYSIYPVQGISIPIPPIIRYDIHTPSQNSYSISNNSIPDWYAQDLRIALKVSSPIKASYYTLAWTEGLNNEPPFGGLGVGNRVLIGERAGNAYKPFYTFDYADGVRHGSPDFPGAAIELSWIYVLDGGRFEAAVLCPLGNAEFLAFAPDQVILGSNHSGFDDYDIYQVQGIMIPSPPDLGQ